MTIDIAFDFRTDADGTPIPIVLRSSVRDDVEVLSVNGEVDECVTVTQSRRSGAVSLVSPFAPQDLIGIETSQADRSVKQLAHSLDTGQILDRFKKRHVEGRIVRVPVRHPTEQIRHSIPAFGATQEPLRPRK